MDVPTLVDAAIREATLEEDSQAPIRQSIGSFLYHLVLAMNWNEEEDGLPDVIVAILCGIMENLSLERDHETALRKLLVIGKILTRVPNGEKGDRNLIVNVLTLTLMKELGYRDEITQVREGNEKVLDLAAEILALVDKSSIRT